MYTAIGDNLTSQEQPLEFSPDDTFMKTESKEIELGSKAIKGAGLVAFLNVFKVVVSSINLLALTRLLDPKVFGVFAFADLVVQFSGKLSSVHGRECIVQTQDNVKSKVDAGFTIELVLSFLIALCLVVWAPKITLLLGRPEVSLYVRILAVQIVLSALTIHEALPQRDLDFRKVSLVDGIALVSSTAIGILLAVLGFGIWSLVVANLGLSLTKLIVVRKIVNYRPKIVFDWSLITSVIKFGFPLTLAGITGYWYWNIDDYLVGRMLGPEQLGYYWFAFKIPHYILQFIESFSSVTFPAFARAQNDAQLKNGFELATKLSAILLLLPTALSLCFGKFVVEFVFGSKWLPAVVPFQIYMALVAFRGIFRNWADVAKAKGHTSFLFRITLVVAIILPVIGYLLMIRYGISGMTVGVAISLLVVFPFYTRKLKQLLPVSYMFILWREFACFSIVLALGWILKGLLAESLFSIAFVMGTMSLVYFGCLYLFDKPICTFVYTQICAFRTRVLSHSWAGKA